MSLTNLIFRPVGNIRSLIPIIISRWSFRAQCYAQQQTTRNWDSFGSGCTAGRKRRGQMAAWWKQDEDDEKKKNHPKMIMMKMDRNNLFFFSHFFFLHHLTMVLAVAFTCMCAARKNDLKKNIITHMFLHSHKNDMYIESSKLFHGVTVWLA